MTRPLRRESLIDPYKPYPVHVPFRACGEAYNAVLVPWPHLSGTIERKVYVVAHKGTHNDTVMLWVALQPLEHLKRGLCLQVHTFDTSFAQLIGRGLVTDGKALAVIFSDIIESHHILSMPRRH